MKIKVSLIKKHLSLAEKLSSKYVEQLARQVLKENPQLDEFIMGFGMWHFTFKEKDGLISHGQHHLHLPLKRSTIIKLENFIGYYDDYLKITGESMRFTAKGKK